MSLFRERDDFLSQNAWQNQNLNALRYNTSQAGSVVPLVYGKVRVPVNLIDLGDFQGPQGKKGKVGPLPITGTSNSAGKGGGKNGGGKKGGKKSGDFSVDVSFAICQGPIVSIQQTYANASVALFSAIGLNLYLGTDGQAPDPTFDGLGHHVGYSGTAYVTGTPMDLGQSPVLPNISFEVVGFLAGSAAGDFGGNGDANPAQVVQDFLTNPRYGAEFPSALLDPNIVSTYGQYCDAASLAVSVMIDGQQTAAEWIDGLAKLTNTEIVWSGKLLKFVPRADLSITGNGVTFDPALVAQYSLTDDDFLVDGESGGQPKTSEGPIQIVRTNPADAINWVSTQFTDRSNFYNATIVTTFDQGAIDAYSLRTGNSVNAKAFANNASAQVAIQLFLQKTLYIRNTYKFILGWKYALLEPMDIVLLTGMAGDVFLQAQPVRILSIEENPNGDLAIEAYEVNVGKRAPYVPPVVNNPPGNGGVWDCETIARKFDTPPLHLGVLENNDQDAVLLGQALFNQCSFSSHRSNSGGKFYFEIARFDHASPDPSNYMRFVVDLQTYELWARTDGPSVSLSDSLIGIGNSAFVSSQATSWPGQVGYDANSMSWGSIIGSHTNNNYYKGTALNTYPPSGLNELTWNGSPTADPSTGVGGIDMLGGLGSPSGDGSWFIIGQMWTIANNSSVLRLFTSSTGFQNAIPSGVQGW